MYPDHGAAAGSHPSSVFAAAAWPLLLPASKFASAAARRCSRPPVACLSAMSACCAAHSTWIYVGELALTRDSVCRCTGYVRGDCCRTCMRIRLRVPRCSRRGLTRVFGSLRIETAGEVILARTSLFCMIIDVTPPKNSKRAVLGCIGPVVQWMSVFDSSVQRSMHLDSQ